MPDVHASIRNPYDKLVDTATASDRLVPCESDRLADEYTRKDSPGTIGHYDAQNNKASNAETTDGKDTEVLGQDGHLDGGEGEIVDPNACPESLVKLLVSIPATGKRDVMGVDMCLPFAA